MTLRDVIAERARASGPLTVAEYMELALYHPTLGYYARAQRRSGRAGDFVTSVDVGSLFGELLARQVSEMATVLEARGPANAPSGFDLVEAGAGDGRLAGDVLDALERSTPPIYDATRLHLVERSAAARAAQPVSLRHHARKLHSSSDALPARFTGILLANELLDALPAHQVVMRAQGLREVYVDVANGRLVAREGPPSTPELAAYLARAGVALELGLRAEINLAAREWVRTAARRLERGFLMLIDYGHEAHELYSATHGSGTLASYRHHSVSAPASGGDGSTPAWLEGPGDRDLTCHVDLSSLRRALTDEGLTELAVQDQTYFLLSLGIAEGLDRGAEGDTAAIQRRLAAKALLLPGGLGSTLKVLIYGKQVGAPELKGCSATRRLT